jgi:hypothetical protein
MKYWAALNGPMRAVTRAVLPPKQAQALHSIKQRVDLCSLLRCCLSAGRASFLTKDRTLEVTFGVLSMLLSRGRKGVNAAVWSRWETDEQAKASTEWSSLCLAAVLPNLLPTRAPGRQR